MDTVKIHTKGEQAPALEASLQKARKAVVLAPHPDDEVLGCAGTLLQLNRRGVASTTVCVTDGERIHGEPSTTVARARQDEARQVARTMGSGDPLFLGLPDGGLRNLIPELAEGLQGIIAAQKPDLLFAPSPIDYHDDTVLRYVLDGGDASTAAARRRPGRAP
jgi:LmbE family N-acetylglucosaminyl deacetylase